MDALKRNWKTTVLGVLIILGVVAQGFAFESADLIGYLQTKWELLVAAVGLILAKDSLKVEVKETQG